MTRKAPRPAPATNAAARERLIRRLIPAALLEAALLAIGAAAFAITGNVLPLIVAAVAGGAYVALVAARAVNEERAGRAQWPNA